MAIITKIRERTVLVLGIVGLALLAFILGDLFSSNASLFAPDERLAGTVDDEPVSLAEFSTRVDRKNQEYEAKSGSRLPLSQMGFVRNQVWDNVVAEIAYKFDDMGIQVTDDEIRDMVQGNNVHPDMVALFTNPETEEFDRQILFSFLQSPDRYPERVRNLFAIIESGLREKRRKEKYLGMLHHSTYINALEGAGRYKAKSSTADIEYLFVPFRSIPDSAINLTESEVETYFEENKEDYRSEAKISLEYVQFSIVPAPTDSSVVRQDLASLKAPFANTDDDTLFTSQYSDARKGIFSYNLTELPDIFDPQNLQPGQVIGPVQSGNTYKLYKYIGEEQDTVLTARASHILLSTGPDITEEQKAEKRQKAEEILEEARSGADFSALARQYSEGPTKSKGGDLGWFKEGAMVAPFEEAVMARSQTGVIPRIVETRFGYHIINVTGVPTRSSYIVGVVSRLIEASEETRDEAYRKAGQFAVTQKMDAYMAQLEKAAERGQKIISFQANDIGKDQGSINDMKDYTGVRNLINWAFKDKVAPGDVSDVTEIGDRFVVAVLVEKVPQDDVIPPFSIAREEARQDLLDERKAEQIIAELKKNSGTLQDMKSLYEQAASVSTQEGIALSFVSIRGIGSAPKTIGRVFGQPVGETSEPFQDQNGVVVLKVLDREAASEVADYTQYRQQLRQERASSVLTTGLKSNKAVSEITDTERYLYKYY